MSPDRDKLYAVRDALKIDEASRGMYGKHVSAMTSEKLHSKSDIAAELAYRDTILMQQEILLVSLISDVEVALKHLKDSELKRDISSTLKKAKDLTENIPTYEYVDEGGV